MTEVERARGRGEPLEEDLLAESADDLYENAPCGYFSALPSGVIVRANATLLRLTGRARQELIGLRFLDLVTIGGRIMHETHYAPLLEMQGYVNEVAFDLVRRDGSQVPVLLSSALRTTPDGQRRLQRATIFDISERKRYERELIEARKRAERERQTAEEERERFRAAFSGAAVGMALASSDGRFLSCNAAYSRITGYTEAELLAIGFLTITHPDDRARNGDLIARLMTGDLPGFVIEKRYVRKDGQIAWVQNSVSVARGAEGQPLNLIVISEEITERRRVEAERARLHEETQLARAAADAASRAKDEFLAMLGPELRNPLAPIQTALQLMRLRGDPSSQRERSVIERQVRHMIRLVDDLLDVSRITRGQLELARERTALADVVATALEMASPLVEQRRHLRRRRRARPHHRRRPDAARPGHLQSAQQRRQIHRSGWNDHGPRRPRRRLGRAARARHRHRVVV